MDEHEHATRSEQVIEENGEERIPHQTFYEGIDDYEKEHEEGTFLPTITPISKYHTMAVVPGPYVRGFLDITSFVICLALVIVQLGLIDYYYLTVLNDSVWYSWVGADAVVIIALLWMVILAVRHNQQAMEEVCSMDNRVVYAWFAWLVYSVVLAAKVATCFRLFYDQLVPGPLDNNDKFFDDHLFKVILSLSVLVFIFLLESHHYTPLASVRQLYLVYLVTAVALDLLDTVLFLDLLWQAFAFHWKLALWLEVTILALVCLNLILPTFTLLKLRFNRNRRVLLISEKVWALFYVLLVNGPFLGIRIYLYVLLEVQNKGNRYDISIFCIKNIAMLYFAMHEVWTRLHYWRQKRCALGSKGQLTAPTADDEN